MEGCIESLYEDWAAQEALPPDALALLLPTESQISQVGFNLPSVRSHGRGSPLTTYAMKADAVPCTPSLLLDPQQQSISAGSTESESNESGDEDCAGMGRSQSAGHGFAAPRAASGHKAASKRSRLEFEASLCGVLQPFDAVKNYGSGRLSLQQLNAKLKTLCKKA